MPFWVLLLINVITFLVTELLRPKPNIENAKPAGLGDFPVPTATEGRAVPLRWGRGRISGPHALRAGAPQRATPTPSPLPHRPAQCTPFRTSGTRAAP